MIIKEPPKSLMWFACGAHFGALMMTWHLVFGVLFAGTLVLTLMPSTHEEGS